MLEQLLTPGYVVFAASFVVMIGIGLVEAVGLGMGHLDLDTDLAEPNGGSFLEWLGLKGGLPILIWLTSLLACFTLAGLVLQQSAETLVGAPLHWAAAAIIALVIGLVANAFCSGIVARFIPEYESTVVSREALLRRRATVLEGTARRGYPARAKVIDQHGQAHYVMVEPHDDGDTVAQGETGLLVRQDGPVFFVLPETNKQLSII